MSEQERTPSPAGIPSLGEPTDLDGMRRERDAAAARVRELEHELGSLRGKVKRLELMMWRRTARRRRVAAYAGRLRALVPPRSHP
jgi:hypothetical protein